jgi:nucleotide-binding universal stress UspA family protein
MISNAHAKPLVPTGRIATIGVGYNGSSRSVAALAAGRELAVAHGARVRVMQVVCPPRSVLGPRGAADFGGYVDVLLRQARERLAKLEDVDSYAVYGIAVDELAAFGEEVDLLVVGLGSRGGATAYLQRHARCPVLVVPAARPICAEARALVGSRSSRSLSRARLCGR